MASNLKEDVRAREEEAIKQQLKRNENKLANEELKKLRLEAAVEDQIIDARVKKEVKRKEYYDAEIKKQKSARMFAEKQRIKQRLIDNATRNLMNQMAADESALEEQVEAMRKKEDDLEALKQRNIKEQKLAIDQACKSAMARRQREREEDARQTEEMVKAWRAKNKEIDDEAEADEKRRHDELMDLKKTQYEQREQYRARVRQERADRLSGDTGEANRILQEDLEFRQEAQREIDKAKAAGRPWYMLQKAKEGEGAGSVPVRGVGEGLSWTLLSCARRRASLARLGTWLGEPCWRRVRGGFPAPALQLRATRRLALRLASDARSRACSCASSKAACTRN